MKSNVYRIQQLDGIQLLAHPLATFKVKDGEVDMGGSEEMFGVTYYHPSPKTPAEFVARLAELGCTRVRLFGWEQWPNGKMEVFVSLDEVPNFI